MIAEVAEVALAVPDGDAIPERALEELERAGARLR
jgi:hypothetical protein